MNAEQAKLVMQQALANDSRVPAGVRLAWSDEARRKAAEARRQHIKSHYEDTGGQGVGEYAGPEGPYLSPYTDEPHYLIRTQVGSQPVYSTVVEGRQPHEGTVHPDLRTARSHLKANGFTLHKKKQ